MNHTSFRFSNKIRTSIDLIKNISSHAPSTVHPHTRKLQQPYNINLAFVAATVGAPVCCMLTLQLCVCIVQQDIQSRPHYPRQKSNTAVVRLIHHSYAIAVHSSQSQYLNTQQQPSLCDSHGVFVLVLFVLVPCSARYPITTTFSGGIKHCYYVLRMISYVCNLCQRSVQ